VLVLAPTQNTQKPNASDITKAIDTRHNNVTQTAV